MRMFNRHDKSGCQIRVLNGGRFEKILLNMKEAEIRYLAGLLRDYRELHKTSIKTPDTARKERIIARQVDMCLAAYQSGGGNV